jgi:hypothetical protein
LTTISAKTILRSRHSQRPDKVLSTLLLRYPRWIHAEGRTHRLLDIGEDFEISIPTPSLMEDDNLSRNASSSRAIPVEKLIKDVMDDPAIPLHWGANQKGMQATEECNELVDIGPAMMLAHAFTTSREAAWLFQRDQAVKMARAYAQAGYHKQIVNRLLEPFSHITVVVSATEWSNFLALRDHPDAEPHIRILAQEIRKELDRKDNIQTLEPGEWHTPFVEDDDHQLDQGKWDPAGITQNAIKLSVACCASTSYKTVEGFDMTMERAIALHDKLAGSAPLHASPMEHVAQADGWYNDHYEGLSWDEPEQHGNFQGFRQYRKMLPNECL